jgi:inorganic pyrophosphatase
MFEVFAGYGLGGSTVALFYRIGSGILCKAAHVGAHLVGKTVFGNLKIFLIIQLPLLII